MQKFVCRLQQEIVVALSELDQTPFLIDHWKRPDGLGWGISCVLQDGNVFEKAGVNISVVESSLTPATLQHMRANHAQLSSYSITSERPKFYVTGISLVLHPRNPHAPTVHLNYRFFEIFDPSTGAVIASWFGGGSDLTPAYLYPEDAVHFHNTLKQACDRHDPEFYPKFKLWCDGYFNNVHRGERRGVGGIFFDDLTSSAVGSEQEMEKLFKFVKQCGNSFLPSYLPILRKRIKTPYTVGEKRWQQLRRGRYVEFNLVHDRGTKFGFQTPGARIESILMSLPLTARWEYSHLPLQGSREAELIKVLRNPVDWCSK